MPDASYATPFEVILELRNGRPRKTIDLDLIRKLAEIQCTQEEIAAFLDINIRTLRRRKDFCPTYKKGMEAGKTSLRRLQFKLAQNNAAMAIFLGKQYLGQRDVHSTELANKEGSTLTFTLRFDNASNPEQA